MSKRVVSGIKPSGELTIGNYLGAMKGWAANQHKDGYENFFFIANLHAITVKQDPELLRKRTMDIVAWLLTSGVDPNRSVIFIQSMIPAHSEICWILNNYVTMGELGKMTQFKDKSQKTGREGQIAGLFDYPVLMAGDVLLYDADEIPVGVDQVQHVELARTIAQRFNNSHGETFKIPKATLTENSSRIMSLNEPEKKMSKSESQDSYVAMDDKPEAIIKKFKRAVTDSDNTIKKATDKPAISNLLAIYSGFTDRSIEEIEKEYEGAGYGKFKNDLGEIVAGVLDSWQKRFSEIREDNDRIQNVISEGNSKAETLAKEKLGIVKDKLGLH
ncbi:MAG: tryptophan--tRNA ligase [Ignavibacteria bacterium]|mgnify:CR=1 FL=1|nr:tryptophan--tRNA ligase [Ignavibacteria bacterium]MBK6875643.1 tryptophan--tRNA ligase [Ignavibacteria bacterium]